MQMVLRPRMGHGAACIALYGGSTLVLLSACRGSDYSSRLRCLWAANHDNNSVRKLHTETHTEEGINWVGANPSRTAGNLDGNGWLGRRDDGRLTHIL